MTIQLSKDIFESLVQLNAREDPRNKKPTAYSLGGNRTDKHETGITARQPHLLPSQTSTYR